MGSTPAPAFGKDGEIMCGKEVCTCECQLVGGEVVRVETAPYCIEHGFDREWICTFGCGHRFANSFVRIRGSREEAHKKMFEYFDKKWCFVYESEEAAGVEKFGYVELNLRGLLPLAAVLPEPEIWGEK